MRICSSVPRIVTVTLFALNLTSALQVALGQQEVERISEIPKFGDLTRSDFASVLKAANVPSRVQVTGSRILWVDYSNRVLSVFDHFGRSLGSVEFKTDHLGRPTGRSESSRRPLQDDLVLDRGKLYLSIGRNIHVWDMRAGQLVQTISFEEPVRLLKPLQDRLILIDQSGESLIRVTDPDGILLHAFGTGLVVPRNPDNAICNEFFALFDGERVMILFKYYPFYRVFSLQGELLDEGEYETPATFKGANRLNPTIEVLRESETDFDTWFPFIELAKYHQGRILAVFNTFAVTLDRDFRLLSSQLLVDLKRGFIANPIDIDAENGRILVWRGASRTDIQAVHFMPIKGGEQK